MSVRISRRDFAKAAAYASLGTAVAGSNVYARALATEGSVDWAMNATIIDGCSCRLLCPCHPVWGTRDDAPDRPGLYSLPACATSNGAQAKMPGHQEAAHSQSVSQDGGADAAFIGGTGISGRSRPATPSGLC
jgi:hypothetical protein